ncbi:MAG: bifunctional diaminohydroxyphosphoribosylaminopyrimidine deaminase/5-amino-6-(5-phosphoribosylamino)uracil reductase RibD, partial [Muribaculaceae bacterium]|nr:bifunctional diaminohydroxyphosphoribosylaminopyrimidine deaminase/5-amino-6-(5-phosphoribosylamino)uracil reductase RibD [Muribaculaceae bacterium]
MDEKEIQSYYSGHFTDADALYMRRALQLAAAGKGHVAPNPMVGAVIVAPDGRVIGEGWHRHYGTPHAEVNAVASVADNDRHLLPQSTIYVTLEPCSHYGKTPPCAKLLIETGFRRVVSATVDPNPLVAGRGLKMLADAGIQTEVGLLGDESRRLNKVFFTAHTHHRPFITLKWAQSADGYLATQIPSRSDSEAPQSTPESMLVFERQETGQVIPIGLSSPIGIRYVHMRR